MRIVFNQRYYNYKPTTIKLTKIKALAKFNLDTYKFNSAESALDAYLRANYKESLKEICTKLINNIIINSAIDDTDRLYIMFKTQELDEFANLITYGNRSVLGSKILRYIFKSITDY